MSDLIDRQAAIDAMATWDKFGYTETGCFVREPKGDYVPYVRYDDMVQCIKNLPSAQPNWIPCSERLPEDRDWVLGIFQETDTGWVNPIPFVCVYVGKKTAITTQDNWILKEINEPNPYYAKLQCVAWQPLPEPYKED